MSWKSAEESELIDILRGWTLEELEKNVKEALEEYDCVAEYDFYIGLQRQLYWKVQDLQKMISLSNIILDSLDHHPDASPRHRSSLLYNIASFTCPWWSDSLEITESDANRGLHAAEVLIKLREDYGFEEMKKAGAYWIVAGHYLYTTSDADRAIKYYEKTEIIAKKHSDDKLSALLRGNSMEGIGRVNIILKNEKDEGLKFVNQAIDIYKEAEDDYSIGEAELFLNSLS